VLITIARRCPGTKPDCAALQAVFCTALFTAYKEITVMFRFNSDAFLERINNPDTFMSGDISVNIEFSQGGKTLREAVKSYLTALE
jgi:hypothetical protein